MRAAFVSHEAARALEIEAGERADLPANVRSGSSRRESAGQEAEATPLVIERSDGTGAAVQLMPARHPGDPDTLLIEPAGELVSIPTLRAAGLTAREAEVLRLVALRPNEHARSARRLKVSPRTVEKHLQNIYEKLGARSRTQAMLTAWSIGRVPS